jgi:hypothetical protein
LSRIETIAEGVILYLGRRIEEATRQPDMFIEQPKPAKQESLL